MAISIEDLPRLSDTDREALADDYTVVQGVPSGAPLRRCSASVACRSNKITGTPCPSPRIRLFAASPGSISARVTRPCSNPEEFS